MQITNGCIVCREPMHTSLPGFDLVRPDLALWVMEVPWERFSTPPEQLDAICDFLEERRESLAAVGRRHQDFSLNLTVDRLDPSGLTIPTRLIEIGATHGFAIGILPAP